MALETGELLAVLGAVVGVATFMGGLVARAVAKEKVDASVQPIIQRLDRIEHKLDVNLERMDEAMGVVMLEMAGQHQDIEESIKRRSPHLYRYYFLRERD